MTYSDDFLWRAIAAMHVYDVSSIGTVWVKTAHTSSLVHAIIKKDIVNEHHPRQTQTHWPATVLDAVDAYVQAHPTIYIEELREYLIKNYPATTAVSTATICRVLNFDLNLSRKVLSKVIREAVPAEINVYRATTVSFFFRMLSNLSF
ncbi:hypothetical protein JG687_00005980 [Phytophthora cactorum]|uniref:Uncharacterized protein n=1 Tax=Phytophthora cactorum TaxID=29920 RepID=A0A8T1UMD1_9STRA|nr:hypothetical protein JG687_00005980 [Phytophthora cactorum]